MTRLTDEELDAIEHQCDGFSMLVLNPGAQRDVRAMLDELRTRRSQDLTAGEVEALKWLQTQARAIQYERAKAGSDGFPNPARALAVLDRLLKAGG